MDLVNKSNLNELCYALTKACSSGLHISEFTIYNDNDDPFAFVYAVYDSEMTPYWKWVEISE